MKTPLNKELIQKLQDDASKLGVAVALPKHVLQLDATSQNHIVFVASQELVGLRMRYGIDNTKEISE